MQGKGDPRVQKVRKGTQPQAKTTVPIYTNPLSETRPPWKANTEKGAWLQGTSLQPRDPYPLQGRCRCM